MSEARGVIGVTGATGFLGRYLCRHLQAEGWTVRALVRDLDAARAVLPGIAAARCDVPDGIEPEALRGCTVLLHAAYATKETDPERMRLVNEEGSRRLFAAARTAGVPRIVFKAAPGILRLLLLVVARSRGAARGAADAARLRLNPDRARAGDGDRRQSQHPLPADRRPVRNLPALIVGRASRG